MRIREQTDNAMFKDGKKRIKNDIAKGDGLLTEIDRQANEWVVLMDETFSIA